MCYRRTGYEDVDGKGIMYREFIDKDGYVCFEYERKKRISKQKYLYQQYHNCKLLPNEVVIFLNGNKRDFSKENLYKITRGELATFNKLYKVSSDPNETLVLIDMVRIKQQRVKLYGKLGLLDSHGHITEDISERSREKYKRNPEFVKQQNKRVSEWRRNKRLSDPAWAEEYNRKQRERRAREKCSK